MGRNDVYRVGSPNIPSGVRDEILKGRVKILRDGDQRITGASIASPAHPVTVGVGDYVVILRQGPVGMKAADYAKFIGSKTERRSSGNGE